MDQQPVAEILPGLYRAVLDSVADLERRGRRREAAELREQAIAIYSRAWTPLAAVRLRSLSARAARTTTGRRPARRNAPSEAVARQDLERGTA